MTLRDDLPCLLRCAADAVFLLVDSSDLCADVGADVLLTAAASMEPLAVANNPRLPPAVLREAVNAASTPMPAQTFLKRVDVPDVDKNRFVRDRCLPPHPDAAKWAAGLGSTPNLPACVYQQLLDSPDVDAVTGLLLNETVPLRIRREAALTSLPKLDTSIAQPPGRLSDSLVRDRSVFELLCRHHPRYLLDRHNFISGLTSQQLSQYLQLLETHVAVYTRNTSMFYRARALLLHPALTCPLLDRIVALIDKHCPHDRPKFEQYVDFATDRVTLRDSAVLYRKHIDGGFFDSDHGSEAGLCLKDPDFTPLLLQRLLKRPLPAEAVQFLLQKRPHVTSLHDLVKHLAVFPPEVLAACQASQGTLLPQTDKFLVEKASAAELAAGLQAARPVPELVRVLQTLIVSKAPPRNLTADVLQHFMYSSDLFDAATLADLPPHGIRMSVLSGRFVALTRIMSWLAARFGSHEPAWVMFAELADDTATVREIADLALALEPLPA